MKKPLYINETAENCASCSRVSDDRASFCKVGESIYCASGIDICSKEAYEEWFEANIQENLKGYDHAIS